MDYPEPHISKPDSDPSTPGFHIIVKEYDPYAAFTQDDTRIDSANSERQTFPSVPSEDLVQIFAQTTPIAIEPESNDFQIRESSLKPSIGEIVTLQFPPTSEEERPRIRVDDEQIPEKSEPPQLKVVSVTPVGKVYPTNRISVKFSEDMIDLTTQEELKKEDVPVKVTPEIPGGIWRWIDLQTIVMEIDPRMNGATTYKVTVPVGVTSKNGLKLVEEFSQEFSTNGPSLEQYYPSVKADLDPVIFAFFDQKVDMERVYHTMAVTGKFGFSMGGHRRATLEEVKSVEYAKLLVENELYDGRWIAVKLLKKLTPGSTCVVKFPGVQSLEGPLPTHNDIHFDFQTYPVFKIESQWPRSTMNFIPNVFNIIFNNAIDEKLYKDSMVTMVTPVKDFRAVVKNTVMSITFTAEPNTRYTIKIDENLTDIYGQKLGEKILHYYVGKPYQAQVLQNALSNKRIILDIPASQHEGLWYTFKAKNFKEFRVVVYKISAHVAASFKWKNEYKEEVLIPSLREFVLFDKVVPVSQLRCQNPKFPSQSDHDPMQAYDLDLSPFLSNAHGHLLIYIEPTKNAMNNRSWIPFSTSWWTSRPIVYDIVTCTHIGLYAEILGNTLVALTTNLADGTPLQGVEIVAGDKIVVTNSEGVAQIKDGNTIETLVARIGETDSTFTSIRKITESTPSKYLWYIVDDRKMYKPNEEVHMRGYIRESILYPENGWYNIITPKMELEIQVKVIDARHNMFYTGTARTNKYGSFEIVVTIPDNVNLGNCVVNFETNGENFNHTIEIQEFRTPEFKVSSVVETQGHNLYGGKAIVSANASYYTGGGISESPSIWNLSHHVTKYVPPNFSDYSFGVPRYLFPGTEPSTKFTSKYDKGITDKTGKHTIRLEFVGRPSMPAPVKVVAECTIMDLNNQALVTSQSFIVHPTPLYIGIKMTKRFALQKQPISYDIVAVDIDGNLIPDIPISLSIKGTYYENNETNEEKFETTVTSRSEGPVTWTFTLDRSQDFEICAKSNFEDQEVITMSYQSMTRPPIVNNNIVQINNLQTHTNDIIITTDKSEYTPGDVAQILIHSPFWPCEGIWSLAFDNYTKTGRFSIKDGTHVESIPILEEYAPNVQFNVALVGFEPRKLGSKYIKNAFGYRSVSIPVSRDFARLKLDVTPSIDHVTPGSNLKVTVKVSDIHKSPCDNAEVLLFAVDESVLNIAGYTLLDPLLAFYRERQMTSPKTFPYYSLIGLRNIPEEISESDISQAMALNARLNTNIDTILQRGEVAYDAVKELKAASQYQKKSRTSVIKLFSTLASSHRQMEVPEAQNVPEPVVADRNDFNPLCTFSCGYTNSEGVAEIEFQVKDNLTRYRIYAVAAHGAKTWGTGEANFVACLPVMVRPTLPRFLNYGDKQVQVTTIVQNQTDSELQVTVAARGSNMVFVDGEARVQEIGVMGVTIKPNQRELVNFYIEPKLAGKAHMQIVTAVNDINNNNGPQKVVDCVTKTIPVWTPASSEAFATSSSIDNDRYSQISIRVPSEEITPTMGGLKVSTSTTILQQLTDAMIYVYLYPYECTEQITSKLLSVVALKDILYAFKEEKLPDVRDVEAMVTVDLNRLEKRMQLSGGFGFWGLRDNKTWPFLTCHVGHMVAKCIERGYNVNAHFVNVLTGYLRNIDSHFPPFYPREVKDFTACYAIYVLYRLGVRDSSIRNRALELHKRMSKETPIDSLAWLLSVLGGFARMDAKDNETGRPTKTSDTVKKILQSFTNAIRETPSTANFVTNMTEYNRHLILHSDRRTDAVVLEALIEADPANKLIPKLVKGLMNSRNRSGCWSNTQDNCWVLLAMDRYFNVYEKETPEFVAKMWLGEQFVAKAEFVGRSTNSQEINIPMAYLLEMQEKQLLFEKEGKGRMYNRVSLNYTPKSLHLKPADYGFVVSRQYSAMDDPSDVKNENGTWILKSGSRVKITIKFVNKNRNYHVAMVDYLPAGLEALNEAIKGTTGRMDNVEEHKWYEHKNIRDERVEAFVSLLNAGMHEFNYIARCTARGEFVVPPAKVEEMYSPEVFGRTGTDFVIIQ